MYLIKILWGTIAELRAEADGRQDMVRYLIYKARLKKPARLGIYWINIGYILSLIGSLIGFFMAISILFFKRTLPNGELIFAYDKFSRKHALIITLISGFLLLLRVFVKLPLFYEVFIPLF